METETVIQELRLALYELKEEKIITEGAMNAIQHAIDLLLNRGECDEN